MDQSLLELLGLSSKVARNKQINNGLRNALIQLEKEVKAQVSFLVNKDLSLKKISEIKQFDKLQVGGGKRILDGYLNLDIFPPADIIWDCRMGLPFLNNTFNHIFSEHFLEHLDFPTSAKLVISEFFRILRPGGELFISVPDARKALEAYNSDRGYFERLYSECYSGRNPKTVFYGKIDYINYLFRDQPESSKYTVHHWAYDFESLSNMLLRAGFKIVTETNIKTGYCNPKREFYSLYLKAIK